MLRWFSISVFIFEHGAVSFWEFHFPLVSSDLKHQKKRNLVLYAACHFATSCTGQEAFLDNLTYTLALWLSSSHSNLCNLPRNRRENLSENFFFLFFLRTWFTSLCKNRPSTVTHKKKNKNKKERIQSKNKECLSSGLYFNLLCSSKHTCLHRCKICTNAIPRLWLGKMGILWH